jgi:hypothetical protein
VSACLMAKQTANERPALRAPKGQWFQLVTPTTHQC